MIYQNHLAPKYIMDSVINYSVKDSNMNTEKLERGNILAKSLIPKVNVLYLQILLITLLISTV